MTYISIWKNIVTNKVINVEEFSELDDALEDAYATCWNGSSSVIITVTNDAGEIITERQIS